MTNPLIDQEVFAALSDAMGAEFAAELVNTFLDDAANMFEDMNTAFSDQDPDGFRRAAHSIKSNAQVFGASALADHARTLELNGLPDSVSAVVDLQAIYDQTAAALRSLLDA